MTFGDVCDLHNNGSLFIWGGWVTRDYFAGVTSVDGRRPPVLDDYRFFDAAPYGKSWSDGATIWKWRKQG